MSGCQSALLVHLFICRMDYSTRNALYIIQLAILAIKGRGDSRLTSWTDTQAVADIRKKDGAYWFFLRPKGFYFASSKEKRIKYLCPFMHLSTFPVFLRVFHLLEDGTFLLFTEKVYGACQKIVQLWAIDCTTTSEGMLWRAGKFKNLFLTRRKHFFLPFSVGGLL